MVAKKQNPVREPLTIVAGLSGAGKTQALKILEDFGFYCVDNLPAVLTEHFLKWVGTEKSIKRPIVLGLDIRNPMLIKSMKEHFRKIGECKIIFLEADNKTLINRYRVTRRRHPLGGELASAILRERKLTSEIKRNADNVIDTSNLTHQELEKILSTIFAIDKKKGFLIQIVSFGYKFSVPQECDMLIDVRFLRNPNYVRGLKYLTGLNRTVQNYILHDRVSREFFGKLLALLNFLMPKYVEEGKSYFSIGFGCTGGHHRSATVSERVAKILRNEGYRVRLFHRDIQK